MEELRHEAEGLLDVPFDLVTILRNHRQRPFGKDLGDTACTSCPGMHHLLGADRVIAHPRGGACQPRSSSPCTVSMGSPPRLAAQAVASVFDSQRPSWSQAQERHAETIAP